METLARLIIILGLILLAIGGVLFLISRTGIPLGRLPGDIRIQTDNITCVFPLVTSIILSIVLTIILNIIVRYLNR
jgi:formate hydrogenlyase subunit 3/multisubunit Na+/H+ antiporter MnhD subunit